MKTPRGFTLVEVVIGMVLMATVVVSLLLASSRHEERLKQARDQQNAIRVADQMLSAWMDTDRPIPLVHQGVIPEFPSWRWNTYYVGHRNVLGYNTEVIQFSIESWNPRKRSFQTLTSIELLQDK